MTKYTLEFEQSTNFNTQHKMGKLDPLKPLQSGIMFTFLHFARRVTIRKKTISEIWAEIGGLWAAATLIMALVFSQSGTTDPKNKKALGRLQLPSEQDAQKVGRREQRGIEATQLKRTRSRADIAWPERGGEWVCVCHRRPVLSSRGRRSGSRTNRV